MFPSSRASANRFYKSANCELEGRLGHQGDPRAYLHHALKTLVRCLIDWANSITSLWLHSSPLKPAFLVTPMLQYGACP